ncbi:Major Facilitator Superfamily protein [Paracoccus halophilus]|uniref:MFS transporter n=1 Tax=Paracoccus halophilus TaxID=376733 RepID=A0A099F0N2_9RHOB|nr:MFS transporter [Paracoccus halophilus]KGJ04250.1 MFS transporter [Paracoccus halophilus]SFA52144.1 Major Facilitator Superfamily protein [Paracoccus halophilus]
MEKRRAVILLCIAVTCGMSPWFATGAAVMDIARAHAISAAMQGLLSSAVQAGFVIGALGFAVTGIPDRFDPRRVMAVAAGLNAVATALLLVFPPGTGISVALRLVAGMGFAGIYPVGMKVMVGWGQSDRGFLVGVLVGALTLGSAMPHLAAYLGGADWRIVIGAAASASALGAVLALFLRVGPYHARAQSFDFRAIRLMWTDRNIRAATGGYLGHMWELYALWSWIGVIAATSYASRLPGPEAESLAALTGFASIALGAFFCVPAGRLADAHGKARIASAAMWLSGAAGLAAALAFGGPVWLMCLLLLFWGAAIIPDSAQFSALIADHAPPQVAGSLMSMQTAMGFALTVITVQLTPAVAATIGWPLTLAGLALGPAFGIRALRSVWR